mgnify:FL=1|tara:strand:+ start:858 stop:1124 length:267 start_codon:yes stop_codon:yes gene_type:complete
MFVDNLRLDVIATFENHQQAHFNCAITNNALENKTRLLDYVKKQLHRKDLVKLSLCWVCPEELVGKFKVIEESIKQNAKYYFKNGKEV